MSFPPAVDIAKAIGTLGVGILAGGISSISVISIPALSLAPSSVAAKQWSEIFRRGMKTAPPISLVSALALAYVAYERYVVNPHDPVRSSWAIYTAAASLAVSIAPFTLLLMKKTNDELLALGGPLETKDRPTYAEVTAVGVPAGNSVQEEHRFKELLTRWKRLNLVRSALPALAFFLVLFVAD